MKFASRAKLLGTATAVLSLLVGGLAAAPAHATGPATLPDLSVSGLSPTFSSSTYTYTATTSTGTINVGSTAFSGQGANWYAFKNSGAIGYPVALSASITGLVSGDIVNICSSSNGTSCDAGTTYSITMTLAGNFSFNSNSNWQATGLVAPITAAYGASVTLPANGYTWNGHTFTAWNTQADGNGTSYNPGDTVTMPSTSYTTLYAKWSVASQPCIVNTYGGQYQWVQPGNPLPSLTRSGYTFSGWSVHSGNSWVASSSTSCVNLESYLANWTPVQSQSSAPARPAPSVKFDSIPTFTPGKNGTVELKGSNLDTYDSVTVGGKAGSVAASTDSGVSFKAADGLAPGAYDIVLKTNGGGSLTIQGGYVVAAPAAAPVDQPKATIAPIRGVTPSVTSVNGFVAGKASAVTAAQKSVVADAVTTNEAKSLSCVGVSSAKVSAKVAQARAAALCDYAKSLNPALVTSVSVQTLADLKAASAGASSALVAPVVLNYLR